MMPRPSATNIRPSSIVGRRLNLRVSGLLGINATHAMIGGSTQAYDGTVTVAANGAATAMNIQMPTTSRFPITSVVINTLPDNGVVTLADGVTVVNLGDDISVAQLVGLTFTPTAGVYSTSSSLSYTVADRLNESSTGTETIVIGPQLSPDPPEIVGIAAGSDTGAVGDLLTSNTQPAVAGTGTDGDTVSLYDGTDPTPIGVAVVVNGAWSITPTAALGEGVHTLTATQTNLNNAVSDLSTSLTLTIDTTPPATPAITSPILTDSPAPTLVGAAETGDTVTVTVAGATYATIAIAGAWSIDLATAIPISGTLALDLNGPNAVSVAAVDPAGNAALSTGAQTLTIDTTPPTTPVVTSPILTDSPAPVLTGTAETGDAVTVTVAGATYTTIAVDGAWSVNLATDAPICGTLALDLNGPNDVSVAAVDPAGNAAPSTGAQTLIIDTTAPTAPVITSPALTDNPAPILTGTAETGDTVTVTVGGATYDAVAVDGVWSVDLAVATPLSGTLALDLDGPNDVLVCAADPAGNAAPSTDAQTLVIDVTPPPAPTITSPILTDDPAPILTGAAETGDTVTVTVAGATYATIAMGGAWSVDLATAIPLSGALALNINGPNAVSAAAVDPAGNAALSMGAQTLVIDTTPPAAPAITSPALTNSPAPLLTGTAETGDAVTVTVAGATYAAIAIDGAWSVDLATAIPVAGALALNLNGANAVSVAAVDSAGNAALSTGAQTLIIDTTPPAAPAITSPSLTNAPTPVLTGTAEAGDTVTVTVAGAIYTTTATGGAWRVNLANATPTFGTLALNLNGANPVSVAAVDPAGNAAPSLAIQTLAIDTTPPGAPTLEEAASTTDPAKPLLDGIAAPGSTVTIYAGGASIGSATALLDGTWQFTFVTALAVGAHTVTVVATDMAGNVSQASAPLNIQVNADNSYSVVSAPSSSGDTTLRTYDSAGQFTQIDTLNAAGQLLVSVTNTSAVIEIYDNAGTLIGTVTQPSTSASSQPIFSTAAQTLAANTGSGPIGSRIDLLAESNLIYSQGNDSISAGPGSSTVLASGAATTVTGGSGRLFFAATTGASTATGGTGAATMFGGAGGGLLQGGSAGGNILVGGGGNTTLLSGGAGNVMVGGAGNNLLRMNAQDTAFGGGGASTIVGGDNAAMIGGGGSNVMVGSSGGTTHMWAGDGSSTLFGGGNGDLMIGGSGSAVMVTQGHGVAFGGDGDASIFGGANEIMVGGSGRSVLVGGGGNETMVGGAGATTVAGALGNDIFFATGGGSMTINEGPGSDEAVLGSGSTSISGGAGVDLYDVVAGAAGGTAVIEGFKIFADQIRLFGYDLSTVQESVGSAGLTITLTDNTHITLLGVTTLASTSLI